MKCSREEMKAKLEEEAKVMAEELMEWSERVGEFDLEQLEDALLKFRQRFSERVAGVLLENLDAVQPAEAPICPRCGKEMRYKGRKETTIESRIGTLNLSRGYYYCSSCREGFFPLDEQVGLNEKNWSEGVSKWMVWLSGIVSYETAEEILQRVGRVNVSDSSIWRCTQERGKQFQELAERERREAMALPKGCIEQLRKGTPKGRMGIAMDGGMMHIRGEGSK